MENRKKTKFKYTKIASEMAKNGDTQRTLGNILGISSQQLRYKLIGKYDWEKAEIDKLCIYYEKDYYDLFSEE